MSSDRTSSHAPEPGSTAVRSLGRALAVATLISVIAGALCVRAAQPPARNPNTTNTNDLPKRLSDTGLYAAGSTEQLAPAVLRYAPQYPLWSDGARKRRYIALPPGKAIDASRANDWNFPIGTRFWKEFSFGERTETRYMERLADGSYRYATYVWDAKSGDALLAPEQGIANVVELRPGVSYDIPSRDDCRACHEGKPNPVLGFGALQLSADRDPLAPHAEPLPEGAVDLTELVRRGLIKGLPARWAARAPRIEANTASARAALGYLFGNCSSCHNSQGPLAALGLDFDQPALGLEGSDAVRHTAIRQPSYFQPPGAESLSRIQPGQPQRGALTYRMHALDPAARMPPIGTRLLDEAALPLIEHWISNDLN